MILELLRNKEVVIAAQSRKIPLPPQGRLTPQKLLDAKNLSWLNEECGAATYAPDYNAEEEWKRKRLEAMTEKQILDAFNAGAISKNEVRMFFGFDPLPEFDVPKCSLQTKSPSALCQSFAHAMSFSVMMITESSKKQT